MNTDPPSNGPTKILIAEDSATQAERLRHLLERRGYEVGVAGNGHLALALARQFGPALIVSDVVMPGMDGYELCRRIKDDPGLGGIPVILVTTMSDPEDVIRGLECGADNFIAKPYEERYLLDLVRYALVNRELRRAEDTGMGLEIYFNNQKHFVTADRLQILNLLLSTYEAAIQRNRELSRARLEAEYANQAKSLFLAAMSHEIRTPLIGVLGMLEVLGHSRLDHEQRRQFDIAHQSAHSLLEIIGDILDYSKIEAGKVELAPEAVSVRDLVSRVVSTFSANATSRGLRLAVKTDDAVAPAHVVDGTRLMQILRNFVSNAIKFTERGAVTVAVRVMEDDARVQGLSFSVSDTGIGMTPEQLGRVFQPFVQADAGTTRRFGGTGLGLVICRRLADLMGGTVRAESVAGQGTVMTLELRVPVGNPQDIAAFAAGTEPAVAARRRPTREHAEREGSLLLLAEDHPVNRKVLAGQLNLAGFCVDTVEDGTRALEKFGAAPYGLVLTDLHMPGLDGYQLTAAIRALEAVNGRARTPIVALTADVVREHIDRCLASGMDDYLSKPVTIRQLTEKLRRWLPHLDWEAASDASPPAQPPVEQRLLDQFSGGDAAREHQLLRLYCGTAEDDLKGLDDAQRRGHGAVADVAHRIKGAALMIGAHEVAEIAKQIEQSARGAGMGDISGPVHELRQAVARVQAYARARERPA